MVVQMPESSWFQLTGRGQFRTHCRRSKSWVPSVCYQVFLLSHRRPLCCRLAQPAKLGSNALGAIPHKWETGILISVPTSSPLWTQCWECCIVPHWGPCWGWASPVHSGSLIIKSRTVSSSFLFSPFPHSFTSAPGNFLLKNLPIPNSFSYT